MHCAAALAAVLCMAATVATASAAARPLAAGSPLDFVSDDGINAQTVRPGNEFRVHLKSNLLLNGEVVAAAGTVARLIVIDKVKQPDGSFALQIALSRFHLSAGDLPVAPLRTLEEAFAVGTDIAAKTVGSIERVDDRLVIRVPLPFALNNDVPYGFFTPVPARTPVPRPTPTPRKSPAPSPSPPPSPSPEPSAS